MENSMFADKNDKISKGKLLNNIVEDLMVNCDSIEAVIIADWQGLSFASKLPKDVNEDEISATTLFTLEGAEGTRKELEKSLLGSKLTYLLMVTEKAGKSAYMFVFPIQKIGYIASISQAREDIALIVQNMKIAARKAAEILVVPDKAIKRESVEPLISEKYKKLLEKLDTLKNVKLPYLESQELPFTSQGTSNTSAPTAVNPFPIPNLEPPPIEGPPNPPEIPLEFLEVETDLDALEPEVIIPINLTKFQIIFLDAKKIKYTVNVRAVDELEAEVKLNDMAQFHPIEIISIKKIE